MTSELQVLLATAAGIGVLHTLLGPDHYLPFAALAATRDWSRRKTLGIVLVCGAGHVAGSVVLGALGIAAGAALSEMVALEAFRADVAGWLLLGFGLAYSAWGLKKALRDRPHSHWHAHPDGEIHEHGHVHQGDHLHVHDVAAPSEGDARSGRRSLTPWVLFIVFIFGPCEALIPVLMVPAAEGSWWGVALVCLVFGVATLLTMTVAVALALEGMARWQLRRLERWSHMLAGLTLVACGLALRLGF